MLDAAVVEYFNDHLENYPVTQVMHILLCYHRCEAFYTVDT